MVNQERLDHNAGLAMSGLLIYYRVAGNDEMRKQLVVEAYLIALAMEEERERIRIEEYEKETGLPYKKEV